MRKNAVAAVITGLALAVTLAGCASFKGTTPPCAPSPSLAHDVLDATNAVRSVHGLGELDWNQGLADNAQVWANEMASSNFVRHSPWTFENILGRWACNTGAQLVASWMQSPEGHAQRILQPEFESVGVGWIVDGRGMWVVQQFV